MGEDIENMGKKSKIVFEGLGVEIDKARVKEDSLVFSFIEQLNDLMLLCLKTKKHRK